MTGCDASLCLSKLLVKWSDMKLLFHWGKPSAPSLFSSVNTKMPNHFDKNMGTASKLAGFSKNSAFFWVCLFLRLPSGLAVCLRNQCSFKTDLKTLSFGGRQDG